MLNFLIICFISFILCLVHMFFMVFEEKNSIRANIGSIEIYLISKDVNSNLFQMRKYDLNFTCAKSVKKEK